MPSWARGRAGRIGPESIALPLLLVAAAALRLSDLNWDSGHLFHPDERHILMVTDGLRMPWPPDLGLLLSPDSPLNPKSFAYGSLIFYLLKFLQWVALSVAGLLGLQPQPETWLEPGPRRRARSSAGRSGRARARSPAGAAGRAVPPR